MLAFELGTGHHQILACMYISQKSLQGDTNSVKLLLFLSLLSIFIDKTCSGKLIRIKLKKHKIKKPP